MGHELVGGIELDFHLAIGGGVEPFDGIAHDMLGERRAGIGLQAPLDRRLGANMRHGECGGAQSAGSGETGSLQEIAFIQ